MLRKLCLILFVGVVLVACGGVEAVNNVSAYPTDILTSKSETIEATPSPVVEVSKTPRSTSQPIAQKTPTLQPTKFEPSPTLVSNIPYLVLTYTPTPQPALQAHEWVPESEILISLQTSCGECYYPPYWFDRLFLYTNGLLLKEVPEKSGDYYYRYLDERKICKVLNTIDQAGFFEYDPSIYKSYPGVQSFTLLEVDAWRSNSFGVDGIGYVADEQAYKEYLTDYWENPDSEGTRYFVPPIILPALRDTYNFISTLDLGGWKVYQPDRAIIAFSVDFGTNYPEEWPLEDNLFDELYSGNEGREIVVMVQGDALQKWIHAMRDNTYYILEDKFLYVSGLDVILPHQEIADVMPSGHDTLDFVYGEPVPTIDLTVNEPISCKVIDGTYEIP